MKEGNCRLCTQFAQLTYEHVPPRASFNRNTRFQSIPFIDYLEEPNPFEYKPKAKIEQGGVRYYSLCRTCNNFLGRKYVKDYQLYSNAFIELAQKTQFNIFEIQMHDFNALNVLKQIVSMFFSINNESFSKNNRQLAEFVLNPQSDKLPEQYRLFNYLNTDGQLRNIPMMALGSFISKEIIVASELAFPPLGHLLTIDFKGDLPNHQEITSFRNCKFDQLISFDFKIFRLPTYLPLLMDYREKEVIEKSIDESL